MIVLTLCCTLSSAYAAANFVLNILDAANEGYNSIAPADPVSRAGGNPGTTLGEQRFIAQQWAFEWWGRRLDSAVDIVVDIQMNPLDCDAMEAVLAGAAPNFTIRDFPGAPMPGTWYPIALANKLAGTDLALIGNEISTVANSDIDNNDSCLFNFNWYYGLGQAPVNSVSFLKTIDSRNFPWHRRVEPGEYRHRGAIQWLPRYL